MRFAPSCATSIFRPHFPAEMTAILRISADIRLSGFGGIDGGVPAEKKTGLRARHALLIDRLRPHLDLEVGSCTVDLVAGSRAESPEPLTTELLSLTEVLTRCADHPLTNEGPYS